MTAFCSMVVRLLIVCAAIIGVESALQPNCRGCFNSKTGVCVLNLDGPSCPLCNTTADCATLGADFQFMNGSVNIWPSGCLAELEAKGGSCSGRLEPFDCDHEKYAKVNSTLDECFAEAKKMHTELRPVKYIGWQRALGSLPTFNCAVLFGEFKGDCVWGPHWSYYDLASGQSKKQCCQLQGSTCNEGGGYYYQPMTDNGMMMDKPDARRGALALRDDGDVLQV